jgi:serine-type D-Ala-D-Ala carboxypeptidase (penicillin-binding protein 5/6)
MLTSLLSLYIFSTINLNISGEANVPISDSTSIIRIAGNDISNLVEAKIMPIKNPAYISPIIQAKSAIGIDLNSGSVLYEKNPHQRLAIASITKLMTIMIIMEENNLTDVATVSANAASTGGSRMDLQPGEQITLENLLYGAIIQSANDSAVALAEYNAGSVEKFVEKMNLKAARLGLLNTHYSNPIGLDDPNNYSSVYDLAKLGKYIYQKELIKKAGSTVEMNVTSVSKDITHKLTSTNDLLSADNLGFKFKGLKTGKTDAAGLCLVTVAENEKGNEVLSVVLNSPDRFLETKILVDWLFRAYNWQK